LTKSFFSLRPPIYFSFFEAQKPIGVSPIDLSPPPPFHAVPRRCRPSVPPFPSDFPLWSSFRRAPVPSFFRSPFPSVPAILFVPKPVSPPPILQRRGFRQELFFPVSAMILGINGVLAVRSFSRPSARSVIPPITMLRQAVFLEGLP